MNNAAICTLNWEKRDNKKYLLYFIEGLFNLTNKIIAVVNEDIMEKNENQLLDAGVEIIRFGKTNSEQFGYAEGIQHIGYGKVAELDNLILTNDCNYGPIFPFSGMFAKMEARADDFWHLIKDQDVKCGLSIQKKQIGVSAKCLRGYWGVFRNTLLRTTVFRKYWTSIRDERGKGCESNNKISLSDYFENNGFVQGAYIGKEKYKELIGESDPRILSDRLIIEEQCPLVDRGLFSCNGSEKSLMSSVSHEDKTRKAFDYIEKNTDYDVDMIWNDILSTSSMSSINDNLHLDCILPTKHSLVESLDPGLSGRVALIQYIYPADLIDYCYGKAINMPEGSDIFVVTANRETEKVVREKFKDLGKYTIHHRCQENRGRDNAALLVTCRDVVEKFEYICFVHGKKSMHCERLLDSIGFREYCFENLLYNETYVRNIIHTFENTPRLGIMSPFTPYMGFLNSLDAFPWSENYEAAQDFLKREYGINRKLDLNLYTPFGGMFWARSKALKTLLSKNWKTTDFPEEPLPAADGLLTHVIERVYPVLAQRDGYYTARVMPVDLAPMYLNIIHSRYRELMREVSLRCGYSDFSHILRWFDSEKSPANFPFLNIDIYERRFICFYRKMKKNHPWIKNFIKKYILGR